MQEVKAVCDRVIIVNKGNIVADDSTETLQRQKENQQIIRLEFDKEIPLNELRKIEGVDDVVLISLNTFKLKSNSAKDIRAAVFQFAVANNLSVLTLQKEEQSLEEVFKLLTQ